MAQSCVVVSFAQSCLTLWDSMDCSLEGSSVHGILQARTLEWVAISFSRGSFWPRDRTRILHLLHWQTDSLPLSHLGSPWSIALTLKIVIGFIYNWNKTLGKEEKKVSLRYSVLRDVIHHLSDTWFKINWFCIRNIFLKIEILNGLKQWYSLYIRWTRLSSETVFCFLFNIL